MLLPSVDEGLDSVAPELKGREEAVPLSVPMLGAVAPGCVFGNVGLAAPFPADVLSELPSHTAVVGAVSVLPSPLPILIVEGDTRDVAARDWEVLTLGSVVVPLPWFMVELSPSPGGIMALLATEAVVTEAKGLPMEDEVAVTSAVGCPHVRDAEVS